MPLLSHEIHLLIQVVLSVNIVYGVIKYCCDKFADKNRGKNELMVTVVGSLFSILFYFLGFYGMYKNDLIVFGAATGYFGACIIINLFLKQLYDGLYNSVTFAIFIDGCFAIK